MFSLFKKIFLIFIFFISASIEAQEYPTKPITLIVPYPPGGTADLIARALGLELGKKIKQPIVIENKAGAGTAIGARYVAEASADGYTLLLGTVSSHAINPAISNVGYDAERDFAPIAPLASIPFVLVANPSSPYKNLSDLIFSAKKSPGTVSYASAGPGTSNHLAGEMLASSANIKMLHVPYRGSAPALADVLAGHVPLMFDLQGTSIPYIHQGKLIALATTSEKRSPLLPEVPTISETGFKDFEVSAWFAIFAPAKIPSPIQEYLNREINIIMKSNEIKKRLADMGATLDTRTLNQFANYIHEEVKKYKSITTAAGLKQ